MRKTYIAPGVSVQAVELERMVALSLWGSANGSDALGRKYYDVFEDEEEEW